MNSIFSIYKRDLSGIVTNWAALIVIFALILLPSFYAWFNIKASWDPYGNTKGLKVAVSNEDAGADIRGEHVNTGSRIMESLKNNKKLGWVFTDSKDADRGVRHGDYYASILIPSDFSKKLGSVLTDNPVKPDITYKVNEKINPIAPKITEKGAAGIVQEVSESFVKTANGEIFKLFNELGIELEQDIPGITHLKKLVFDLEKQFPEITGTVNQTLNDAEKARGVVKKAEDVLPKVQKIANEGAALSKSLSNAFDKSRQTIQRLEPFIKQDLNLIRAAAENAGQTAALVSNPESDPGQTQSALKQLTQSTDSGITVIAAIKDLFQQLDQLSGNSGLKNRIPELTDLQKEFVKLNGLSKEAQSTNGQSTDVNSRLQTAAQNARTKAERLSADYDTRIRPSLLDAADRLDHSLQDGASVLAEANSSFPKVEKLVSQTAGKLDNGIKKLKAIQKALPAAEKNVHKLADKIRAFDKKENLTDLVQMLKNNFQKESDFFAHPVLLKEKRLYPIPNYGSGLAPFYTALSLWVGGLLLVSLLTVKVERDNRLHRSYQEYLGRFLTFWTIGLFQAAIVAAGDIFLLHVYMVNPGWFLLFALLNSTIFMLIIYTLVSVFDNAGKAMAIIFLVLQIAGSGGTFPIQVTPPFFQAINPFLPFTYGISLLREASGGILLEIVQRDAGMLIGFGAIALVFGLFLKKPINKASSKFKNKAEESKLIH